MKDLFRGKVFGLQVSRVIEFLTLSDILMISGWGLITPIIAVFFTEQVEGGTVALAGLASTAYFLTKSLLQIPVARFIDRERGEWDDWRVMVVGSLIISASAFSYIFVRYPWQVIAVQIMYGVGGALSYPSWLAIFTRHIDRRHEGFEWSIYFTSIDVGAALTGAIGGLLAAAFGYKLVFIIVGTTSLIGTFFLAGITRELKKRA
jgi:DHA1 family quinolone resistance protein-like MFS transporter